MNVEIKKEILDTLRQSGHLEYGATINRSDFLTLFGIHPLTEADAVKQELTFNQVKERMKSDDLAELGAVDFVRKQMLYEGKFFERTKDAFRIALPSENAQLADNYMKQAQRKIRRARTLLKNTPAEIVAQSGKVASRLLLAERQSEKRLIQ